ncbi:hypothetical protein TYRP_019416 [Tyrophagus putrescentiae]|nr:hypothetical protein TYRP_019416 [Tyrophagus putrescentiae]
MFYSEESCSGSGGQWKLSLETLKRCPVLMYHQTFPRPIWTQIDISFSIAATCYAAVFATFLLKGPQPFSCRYVVDKKQPQIILSFGGKIHVLLINAVYTVSLRDGLLILLFFPLHLFYTMYSKCETKMLASFDR